MPYIEEVNCDMSTHPRLQKAGACPGGGKGN